METELLIRQDIPFDAAVQRLFSFRVQYFYDITGRLENICSALRMNQALQETGLGADDRLAGLDIIYNREEYLEMLISVISDHFPVYDEIMYSQVMDGEIFSITPYTAGLNHYSQDDFYEASQEPENHFEPDQALLVFLKYLDIGYAEEEWALANQYFDWGVETPPEVANRDSYLDTERFEEMLALAGLSCFRDALDVAIGLTNRFFYTNPYDNDESVEFTTENFLELKNEWHQAEEILLGAETALGMVSDDKTLYQKFIYIWLQCLAPRERARVRV